MIHTSIEAQLSSFHHEHIERIEMVSRPDVLDTVHHAPCLVKESRALPVQRYRRSYRRDEKVRKHSIKG